MKRRHFIKASSLFALTPLFAQTKTESPFKPFTQALPIPKQAAYTMEKGVKTFELTVREGEVEFYKGLQTDTFEIWEIWNPSPRPHPFHVHGTGFKILSRDGKPPLVNETGLKDTVLVYPGEKVQIMVVFRHLAPKEKPYMYHCHILEHEDAGMMGQFVVET